MIKCKFAECDKFEGCCLICPNKNSCDDCCDKHYSNCNYSEFDEAETGIVAFQTRNIETLKQVANILTEKKKLDEQEKKLKEALQQAMEQHGIKKFESDILNITYVGATSSSGIDTAKLKKLHPEIAAQCTKISPKSAYVKVTVKDKNNA